MKMMRLVSAYLRHNMMAAMAYRTAFFIQVVGMMLNNTMLLFFWWVLFEQLPSLRGWSLDEVVALYGIVAFGFGAAHVVCGNSYRLAQIITSGDLDYYLALPADPLLHLLISRMSLPSWGDMLFGLLLFIVPGHWAALPLLIVLGLLSGVIMVSFAVIVGSLSFWLGNADSLAAQLNNALITFGLYPVDIFPPTVRLLLYTLVPAAFVSSLPVGLLYHFDWAKLMALLLFTVTITALARWVFGLGLRRYESGNLVTMRG